MKVLKFGGTSVSSLENLKKIEAIIHKSGDDLVIVASAFSGITNQLDDLASSAMNENFQEKLDEIKKYHFTLIEELLSDNSKEKVKSDLLKKFDYLEAICKGVSLLQELSERTNALILSFGEEFSLLILSQYFKDNSITTKILDTRNLIKTSEDYLNAEVDFKSTNENLTKAFEGGVYLASGFLSSNKKGETTVLGRGGSDYTAAIIAAALNAEQLEIWSDVNGLQSTNPRKVSRTKVIQKLSYAEAFEMAFFGAKVIYPPSVLPVKNRNIPILLKNTNAPEESGTLINSDKSKRKEAIAGLSSLSDIAILTISGVGLARKKGRARTVFQIFEEENINIILITQGCSEQSIGIGINQASVDVALKALDQAFEKDIANGIINPIRVIYDQCIIAVVGDNMRNRIGLSGRVFSVLGENGVNVTAIAQGASERNISIAVNQQDETKALNVIHERFFSDAIKTIHLFIAGVGNVGSEFLKIVYNQKQMILNEHQIQIKIMGVFNSTKYLINESNGLTHEECQALNQEGNTYQTIDEVIEKFNNLNLRNSVFIDNTASEIVSHSYLSLIKKSTSVIACNKVAFSSDFSYYNELKQSAKEFNCNVKYETAVGAALPIIKTIDDLIFSGDRIRRIEAVISGSLNFIFNKYDGSKAFVEIVKQAKIEGYTEPNPLIDLSGLDVKRKVLILAREAGYKAELSDIESGDILPKECLETTTIEEFFASLEKNEDHFLSIYNQAKNNGNKLKVVARMNGSKLSVGLQEIRPDSPLYNLEGKDNVVSIYSDRYPDEPMVVKGAGAGAEVTASGVFADLAMIINR